MAYSSEDITSVNSNKQISYVNKVWIAVGIVALMVIIILTLKVVFDILLMTLAGSLIAVFFHGLGDTIQRWTKLKRYWSMALSVVGTFVIFGLLCWFMGTKIQVQVASLSNDLPLVIQHAEAKIKENTLSAKALDSIIAKNDSQKLLNTVQNIFSTGFGVLGNLYIIIFLGIFFTVSPNLYKDGIIKLVPKNSKPDAKHILERISTSLKGWLKGMMIAMAFIALLTTVGLTIIGIPMTLALAIIAGLLNFIPNFGPLVAMIPAVLLGLVKSTNTAIVVAALYVLIQAIESNVITPLVQKRMINLPPALTIISQLIMGTLTGLLGILLATPLLAIIIVLVDELYVKKQEETENPQIIQTI